MKSRYKKIKIKTSKPKKHDSINIIKPFNYGFAILKSILAFLVVVTHQFKSNSTQNKLILNITRQRYFHVPCFFTMSFYFMFNTLYSLNPKKIFIRIIRLLIPYIGWPLILFELNKQYNKFSPYKLNVDYERLKIQLLWGTGFLLHFWYMWNLIAITIIFIIIIFIFRKYSLIVLHIMLFLSYVSQYSGYSYNKIKKEVQYKRDLLGRMFEMMPYAVIGFTLGYYNIINILQNMKIKTFIFSILIYNFVDDYKVFADVQGFLYTGIYLTIRSVCVIFIFSLFPSDKINNEYLTKFLKIITNYSGGVYYLHWSLITYLNKFNNEFKNGTFYSIFLNYLICYFICYIGNLIFGKTPLKYLFC